MVAIDFSATPHGDRSPRARRVAIGLAALLVLTCFLSLSHGASGVRLDTAAQAWLSGHAIPAHDRVILWEIRMPRMLTGLLVGVSLAVGEAVMQGLFRNPLADPGLVGVGAGAGLGAVLAIVLGGQAPAWIAAALGWHMVPVAAFFGGWVSTLVLYRVSTRAGRTSTATMLLAGIALGALAGAATGILVYVADDQQLRDLTFWGLGSLGGASWPKIAAAGPVMLLALVAATFLARGLNGLALGEAAAHHIGLPVQRVKHTAILTVAAATGAAVAVSGGIGFIGIVVPHLLRLATGPDHRFFARQCGPCRRNPAAAGRPDRAQYHRTRRIADRDCDSRHWRAGVLVDIAAPPRSGGSVMLALRNLHVALGRARVLHGVDATAAAGRIVAVIGPNGSGKTTLLRALSGGLAYQGQIKLDGSGIARQKPWELAARRGVLPQAATLAFPFTVAEVVRLGLTSGAQAGRSGLIARALEEVDLSGFSGRYYQELSGGQQARVQLARVRVQVWEPVLDGRAR